jgi:hemerythrin
MVPSFLDEEHRALDHTLADVEYLAQRRSFQSAAKRFGELRRAMERHLHDEEDVLLPAFESRTGDPDRILPMIRAQHASLLDVLDSIAAALSCDDYNAFCAAILELGDQLRAHEADEERVLHPALDRVLPTDADWKALVNAVKRRGEASP